VWRVPAQQPPGGEHPRQENLVRSRGTSRSNYSAAMDRFRIRHRPFSLTAGTASSCPTPAVRNARRDRLNWVVSRNAISRYSTTSVARARSDGGSASAPSSATARRLRELPKRSSRGRWPAEAFCLAPIPVIRSARSAPPNRGSPACPSGLELDDQPSSRTTSLQPPMSVGRPFRRIDLCHTKRDFAGLYLLPEPI